MKTKKIAIAIALAISPLLARAANKQTIEQERRAIEVDQGVAERRAVSNETEQRIAEARLRTFNINHSNRNTYSPEIERAFAARGAAGLVLQKCADRLDINMDKLEELDRAAGIGPDETPSVDVTRRVTKAAMQRMAEAALKHDISPAEMEQTYAQCALFLYTFGPEGTWIRGLVSERSQ